MTDASPLIVPVDVSAWVLNPQTAQSDPRTAHSMRGAMEYSNLQAYGDPSPPPFQADDPNFVNETANHGAYVMWTLPAALRRATLDPATGSYLFPTVPNRWLVVRHLWPLSAEPAAPAQQDAWVVQSDALGEADGVPYLDPTQPTPTPTLIGHKVAVSAASPWQEPATTSPVVLQAVADGNPSFAAYQPFNQNVFSIHDDLMVQAVPDAVISYDVVGWYSDPAADVLGQWDAAKDGAFAEALAGLGWTASTAQASTHSSLYRGQVPGVIWTPDGQPTVPPQAPTPQVAVANTSTDAVIAHAEAALATDPIPGVDAAEAGSLLEAFQYNLLPLLGAPGTSQMIDNSVRAHWFSATEGGTSWVIVDDESPGDTAPPAPPTAAQLAVETALLTTLNAAQATVDGCTRQLVAERRRLVELWWKEQAASYFGHGGLPWGISSAQQLTDAVTEQATTVQDLVQARDAAHAKLPTPARGAPLGPAIAAFATAAGLLPTRLLKAVPAEPFQAAADPVMVVSGTDSVDLTLQPAAQLACRWSSELVTAITVTPGGGADPYEVNVATLSTTLPANAWPGLQSLTEAVLTELFLLDPATTAAGAKLAGQTLTAVQLDAAAASIASPAPTAGIAPALTPSWPWSQPWQPLYLDWNVQWLPIPFQQPDGTANWAFDGTDYATTAAADSPGATPLLARCLLTPKPGYEFRSRLEQFIADNPTSPATTTLQQLDAVLETVDQWDFMSQAFSGFSTGVALWNPIPMQNPPATPLPLAGGPATLPDLLAGDLRYPPQSSLAGHSGGRPVPPPTTSTFEGMRAGQMLFGGLCVVDAFGQALDIVTQQTSATYHPLRAADMVPAHPVIKEDPARILELAPRLLQPARLNLDLFPQAPSRSPILGWVLANHLDEGIAVYGEDGTAYGELRPVTNVLGAGVVGWFAAAASPYTDLPSLTAAQPDLSGFLTGLAAAGQTSFAAFIAAIDETLWTVDPLGARTDAFLSVMLGRPLAVVAASLSFELQSAAVRDPSWPFTFSQPPIEPLFLNYSFPVRLGDLGFRQDGLLGYFTDHAYAKFNAVHVPVADPYLAQVEPGNYVNLQFAASGSRPARALTMLVDPRASVHAACGLLPSTTTTLDPDQVSASLGRMDAAFRTGPALVEELADNTGKVGITVPTPAERHGTWSWSEYAANGTWTMLPLSASGASGGLPAAPPTLREGFLNLSGGLDE